jgi:hypothetical protein
MIIDASKEFAKLRKLIEHIVMVAALAGDEQVLAALESELADQITKLQHERDELSK